MKRFIWLVFLACLWSNFLRSQSLADVEKIKAKLYTLSLENTAGDDAGISFSTADLLLLADSAGKWPDINYKNKTASKWEPAQHWQRLLAMATDYKTPGGINYGNLNYKNAIIRGIGYWLKETPVNTNYWWNAIGIPGIMGRVYILMEKELADSMLQQGVRLLKLGTKPTHYEYYGVATGQNLLWLASAHLYAACITNDVEAMKRVFAAVGDEIKITTGEGIQPDYSFYQHGNQNYAMGYGKGFTETAVRFFYLANQTAFQFPQNKLDIISHYILDGQQWMTRYSYLEYTAMGREISRQGNNGKPIIKALEWMMLIDTVHVNEYRAFYKRLSGDKSEVPLTGNRYFWRSDLMVHQRNNYYFSLKAVSSRIAGSETGNGENLKGYYQGNGTCYLIRNGDEYKDIFPVWDWRKLPGLLTRQTSDTFPLITWGIGAEGNTSFVYGISDSLYGCFGYDYDKQGVTAHRSWFFFDHEIVHLANGVHGNNVYQSINQSLLNGMVWRNSTAAKNTGNGAMVFHDSVGYCIHANSRAIELKQGKQTGSWKQINLAASAETVSKNVFSLGINMGENAGGSSFSYTIIPAISLRSFRQYQLNKHVVILRNSAMVQAVYQKDIGQVQAVFFKAAALALPWEKLILTMKKPGLVLVKKTGNTLFIQYSQPLLKKQIEITSGHKNYFENDEIQLTHQP